MNDINTLLGMVEHKNKVKSTTTLKFKKDVISFLSGLTFPGDILEIGTGAGHTTAILGFIARDMGKKVYSFENNDHNIKMAQSLLDKLELKNCTLIQKNVYEEAWDVSNIGCVFIDCVHTEECFKKDIENAILIAGKDPVILIHDYGLVTSTGDSIKNVIEKNGNRYAVTKFLGERFDWNKLGSGKVIDWEGAVIEINKNIGNYSGKR